MFLQIYVSLHSIPRELRIERTKRQMRHQVKTLCEQNNINLIEAPVHGHRATGLVERLTQTIKCSLAFMKTAANKRFNLKSPINSII